MSTLSHTPPAHPMVVRVVDRRDLVYVLFRFHPCLGYIYEAKSATSTKLLQIQAILLPREIVMVNHQHCHNQ
jgi:hypothetical protein